MDNMTTPKQLIVPALALAAVIAGSPPAQAQTITTGPTNLVERFYVDPVDYGSTQVPPAPATAEQATITVPSSAPTTAWTYAWLMAGAYTTWTQVGIAWPQGGQPYVFADTGQPGDGSVTPYVVGPTTYPGAAVTVRVAQLGKDWVDEWLSSSGWQVLASAQITAQLNPPYVETYGDGTGGVWPFRGVGWAQGNVWHHMASTPIGLVLAPSDLP